MHTNLHSSERAHCTYAARHPWIRTVLHRYVLYESPLIFLTYVCTVRTSVRTYVYVETPLIWGTQRRCWWLSRRINSGRLPLPEPGPPGPTPCCPPARGSLPPAHGSSSARAGGARPPAFARRDRPSRACSMNRRARTELQADARSKASALNIIRPPKGSLRPPQGGTRQSRRSSMGGYLPLPDSEFPHHRGGTRRGPPHHQLLARGNAQHWRGAKDGSAGLGVSYKSSVARS